MILRIAISVLTGFLILTTPAIATEVAASNVEPSAVMIANARDCAILAVSAGNRADGQAIDEWADRKESQSSAIDTDSPHPPNSVYYKQQETQAQANLRRAIADTEERNAELERLMRRAENEMRINGNVMKRHQQEHGFKPEMGSEAFKATAGTEFDELGCASFLEQTVDVSPN